MRQRALVVPDKADRVVRFHEGTLEALRELLQAAGVHHPREFDPSHIVRRSGRGVTLLSQSLALVKPGALLRAELGDEAWPFDLYRYYWPRASADRFTLD